MCVGVGVGVGVSVGVGAAVGVGVDVGAGVVGGVGVGTNRNLVAAGTPRTSVMPTQRIPPGSSLWRRLPTWRT